MGWWGCWCLMVSAGYCLIHTYADHKSIQSFLHVINSRWLYIYIYSFLLFIAWKVNFDSSRQRFLYLSNVTCPVTTEQLFAPEICFLNLCTKDELKGNDLCFQCGQGKIHRFCLWGSHCICTCCYLLQEHQAWVASKLPWSNIYQCLRDTFLLPINLETAIRYVPFFVPNVSSRFLSKHV